MWGNLRSWVLQSFIAHVRLSFSRERFFSGHYRNSLKICLQHASIGEVMQSRITYNIIYVCDIVAWKWGFFRSLLAYGHLTDCMSTSWYTELRQMFVTSKKFFFRSMAISSVRLYVSLRACVCVCLLTLPFVNDSGRNFAYILIELGRKLRLNELSRPLNFGWPWARFKVKVTKKPKKLMQCLTAYISLVI